MGRTPRGPPRPQPAGGRGSVADLSRPGRGRGSSGGQRGREASAGPGAAGGERAEGSHRPPLPLPRPPTLLPSPGGSRRWGARSRRGRALGVEEPGAGCVSGSAPRPRRLRVAVARAAPGRRPGRGEGLGAPARGSRAIRAGAGRRGVSSGPLGRRLDVPSGEPRRPARARRRRPGRWPGPRTKRPPDDADAEPALPRSKPPVLSLCPLGIRRPRAVHGNLNCWNLKRRTRLWLFAFFLEGRVATPTWIYRSWPPSAPPCGGRL